MSEVKRYSFDSYDGTINEDNLGFYIMYSDYEKIKAENAELKNTVGHWQIKNEALKWDVVQDKITKLTRQRDVMKKALEFYADRENWRNPNPIIFNDNRSMGHDLSYENPDDENCHKQHGGKTARKALQEAEAE